MANTRAFISFDADNNKDEKILFCGQTYLSSIPFDVEDWSSKEVLPQKIWEQTIELKVAKCHTLIVLVGKRTSAASGVIKEIAMAHKLDVPVFGVYVGGADASTPLPAGLQRNRTIEWTWKGIAAAIQQMLNEGKNGS
jgi:hypothetical protein